MLKESASRNPTNLLSWSTTTRLLLTRFMVTHLWNFPPICMNLSFVFLSNAGFSFLRFSSFLYSSKPTGFALLGTNTLIYSWIIASSCLLSSSLWMLKYSFIVFKVFVTAKPLEGEIKTWLELEARVLTAIRSNSTSETFWRRLLTSEVNRSNLERWTKNSLLMPVPSSSSFESWASICFSRDERPWLNFNSTWRSSSL